MRLRVLLEGSVGVTRKPVLPTIYPTTTAVSCVLKEGVEVLRKCDKRLWISRQIVPMHWINEHYDAAANGTASALLGIKPFRIA